MCLELGSVSLLSATKFLLLSHFVTYSSLQNAFLHLELNCVLMCISLTVK
jgi:hypothetical protein